MEPEEHDWPAIVARYFKRIDLQNACPFCGETKWLVQGPNTPARFELDSRAARFDGELVPRISIVCDHCGYIASFALARVVEMIARG